MLTKLREIFGVNWEFSQFSTSSPTNSLPIHGTLLRQNESTLGQEKNNFKVFWTFSCIGIGLYTWQASYLRKKNYCQIGTLIIRFSGSSTQFLIKFKPISFCVTLLFICLALTFDSTDRYTGPILDQAEPSGILLNRSDSPACVVSESDSPTSSRSAEGLAEKENKQYGK